WAALVPDWPGHGRSPRPPDFARMSGSRVVQATRTLLEEIGPTVLVTHSMSGAFGWRLAEVVPGRVRAIVAVAPAPPRKLQPWWSWPAHPPDQPPCPPPEEGWHLPTSPRLPPDAFDIYFGGIVPESARIYNERLNVRGSQLCLDNVASLATIPKLIVSAETDPNHPGNTDATTAAFVGAEHLILADHGLPGHGHL